MIDRIPRSDLNTLLSARQLVMAVGTLYARLSCGMLMSELLTCRRNHLCARVKTQCGCLPTISPQHRAQGLLVRLSYQLALDPGLTEAIGTL